MLLAFFLAAAEPLPEQVGEPPVGVRIGELLTEMRAFYADKDDARDAAAYARLAPSLTAYLTPAMWAEQGTTFRTAAGKPGGRSIGRLTWYRDPPGQPRGSYVAADYRARFSRLRLMCGWTMWHRGADGRWRVVSEEQDVLDEETAKRMPPERLKPLERQFGCPG